MSSQAKGKVVVGLSGGVDSSVALLLLKKQGYGPVGVSLKYSVWDNKCNFNENICCSSKSFKVAENICKKLKVPYYKINVEKEFKQEVIDYFTEELKENRTPSPCVFCNANLKFKVLLLFARQIGANFVATGHYARKKISKDEIFELWVPKDKKKDQTYSLSFLPQNYLKHIIFPLQDLTKEEVYKIAKAEKGFEVFEKTKQSQDFCFVSGRAMPEFLKTEIGVKKGKIVDKDGNVLGEHSGLHFYTIGQRKGINIPGGPYFVNQKKIESNILVVDKDQSEIKEVFLKPVRYISGEMPSKKLSIKVKVRSTATKVEAVLNPLKEKEATLTFKEAQKSVTAGQFAVFYDGEKCLGSGVIN